MKLLFCFGTRPEAIKMASLIEEANLRGHKVVVCVTGQHVEMLEPFLRFFNISIDINLKVMKENQSLASLTSAILTGVDAAIKETEPDIVFVQGDTTTTFAAGLAAFYNKKRIVHIEAGLRTSDLYSPYPEEANRQLVSRIADYHFAPTEQSLENLKLEGITKNIFVSGNTSIDSLRMVMDRLNDPAIDIQYRKKFDFLNSEKSTVLVTVHRRENHGVPLLNICAAIKDLAKDPMIQIVLPVHLNPNVRNVVNDEIGQIPNVFLVPPMDYVDFIWMMRESKLILTDSGGVQEEAPYLKKPILVLRENTERPEGIAAGVALLVGSDRSKICSEANAVLNGTSVLLNKMGCSPYGDGFAAKNVFKNLSL